MSQTLTLELTHDDLARLEEGTSKFGTCAVVKDTTDGTPIWITVNNGKPKKPRANKAGANTGDSNAG